MDPKEKDYIDDYDDTENSEYDSISVPKKKEYNDDDYDGPVTARTSIIYS